MQTDRGKNYLNRPFQDTLKRECIRFHVCINNDVKCAVVDRAHRTLGNNLYMYFTYKNTYRFVDMLQRFLRACNKAPAVVTDKLVLDIRIRMND